MKKNNLFLLILSIAFIFVVAGCGNNVGRITNKNNDSPSVVIPPSPTEVVEIYMQHTLGMIPGADIDYDKAKEYLTDELKQQFTTPMFVPASYCIQDGPTDVKVISDEIQASSIRVVIAGLYGSEWQDMWEFSLVPDSANADNHWLIKEIKCLSQ